MIKHQEVFALQQDVGRPFTWTALLTVKGYPYHEKVIAEHDAAREEGIEVWPQVSCRPLVFQMNLAEPFTLNMRPSFAELMGRPRPTALAAYRDPRGVPGLGRVEPRQRASPFNWAAHVGGGVGRPAGPGRPPGAELAEERGCTRSTSSSTSPWPTISDPLLLGAGQRRPGRYRLAAAAGQRAARSGRLGRPRLQLCDACFATDLLGNWVRDRERDADRTGHPQADGRAGRVFGLPTGARWPSGRRPTWCVFDPATVAPGPLRRVRGFPGRRRAPDRGRTRPE